jgi:hypothetical protein
MRAFSPALGQLLLRCKRLQCRPTMYLVRRYRRIGARGTGGCEITTAAPGVAASHSPFRDRQSSSHAACAFDSDS